VANAGISGVTAALNLGPSLSFGSTTTRSSAATGSEPFAFSRSGDVIQGVGDTVLTGTVEIDLDAYSACGGLFCLGWADEGAVLFGIDDVSQSSFVSSDEYATWGRAVAPDGYEAQFSLTLTGGFCGDGTTDPPEECDDGNISNNDGCSSNCLNEFCGDGIRQSGIGEECDDGNTTNGDGCSAICEVEGVPVPALSSRGEQFLVLALIGVAALVVGFRRRRPA
jgi:cysteine-rich repeat protein